MIPLKRSNQWLSVYIFYTIAILIGLLITRVILGSDMSGRYILNQLIISMASALIPCIGGFLGRRIFFIVSTLSIVVGILYMFYVVVGNTAHGWSELASIVGYLFIVGVGFILALVAEIISYFVKTKSRR